jgi:hypothetical protein
MSRTRAIAAAVAVGAVVAGAASASAVGEAPTAKRTEVINLVISGDSETLVDLGPKGFSAGDQEIVAVTVLRDGRKVGRGSSVCQFVEVTAKSALDVCSVVLSLPAGQLTADGLVASSPAGPGPFTLAITGGTGGYRTARGELTVIPQSSDTVPVTVRLIR